MKRSFWITLAISAVACCLVLFSQRQHNKRLAVRVAQEKMPVAEESQSLTPSAALSPNGTVEEARVASVLAEVERFIAGIGLAAASPSEQVAAISASIQSGTSLDIGEFDSHAPELLRLVKNLNLDELIALAQQTPPSQAKIFLGNLVAEQDPIRLLGDRSLLNSVQMSESGVLDALARIDPAAAMQRLKSSMQMEEEGAVRKGNKTRMRRYAALMMQDDVEKGLRELMWMRDIKDSDSMETTRFDRPSLTGVDTAQLIAAMADPEFAEIRSDIISMMFDHQLIDNGVTAVAQLAQSMSLTQKDLTKHLETLIDYDIMASEPEATLAWIAEAQPDEAQLKMVPKAFLEWAKSDAVAARDWLMEQEQSPLRDTTIANFSRSAPNLDRQSAAQWALEIQDEGKRTNTLRHVVKKWRKEDAASANAWLTENGLSL